MVWIIYDASGEVFCVTLNDDTKELMLAERVGWYAEEKPVI